MSRPRVNKTLDRLVRDRAKERCEYCHLPESSSYLTFPIDHVIARVHGGLTEADNLALSCQFCNTNKGTSLSGIDPLNGRITRLYHPRKDSWSKHFEWDGPTLIGLTSFGRTTIAVLLINDLRMLAIRDFLIEAGLFP